MTNDEGSGEDEGVVFSEVKLLALQRSVHNFQANSALHDACNDNRERGSTAITTRPAHVFDKPGRTLHFAVPEKLSPMTNGS